MVAFEHEGCRYDIAPAPDYPEQGEWYRLAYGDAHAHVRVERNASRRIHAVVSNRPVNGTVTEWNTGKRPNDHQAYRAAEAAIFKQKLIK